MLLFRMCVWQQPYRLDVDKLDYLKRDNSACGELTTSEFSSLYENMKVGAQLKQLYESMKSVAHELSARNLPDGGSAKGSV